MPCTYEGYDGVDIKVIFDKSFEGIKCYVRGDRNGGWIETEYITIETCEKLKNRIGELL